MMTRYRGSRGTGLFSGLFRGPAAPRRAPRARQAFPLYGGGPATAVSSRGRGRDRAAYGYTTARANVSGRSGGMFASPNARREGPRSRAGTPWLRSMPWWK